jgi:hypothetical protein
MKRYALLFLSAGLVLTACEPLFFKPSYRAGLPPLPETWAALLPPPHWRLEWIDRQGRKQNLDAAPGEAPALDFVQGRAGAVLAFPCWPERNLPPGLLRPAGGIYPFDLEGDRLILSWRGGVDAWVWRELAAAIDTPEGEAPPPARRPENFDWPRFRKELEHEDLAAEIRRDPWIADWAAFSRKTLRSSFRRSFIAPRSRKELLIPASAIPPGQEGPLIGPSPFAEPINREPGAPLRVNVGAAVETFISAGGILRCSGKTWIWLK